MPSREVCLLLVDDDPFVIQAMARMLAQYPDQRFATSGEAALRIAREAKPDLVVLDVDMPGMSGFEVCEALKADPGLAHIPVIFVTSHNALPTQIVALQKGAADFIGKPLVAAQLTARVRAQLRGTMPGGARSFVGPEADLPARQPVAPAPSILLVDDDDASLHILRHTLQEIGELHSAQSGQEALRLAACVLPDLVVLDAQLPGLDGFEVCKSLKAEAHLAHIPIAFVTQLTDPRHETRAFELGAADYICKPYAAAVLRARVRNLLDLKRRTDVEMQAVREHWRGEGDKRVAQILGASSEAVVTRVADGNDVRIDDGACRMSGVDQGEAIGFSVSTWFGHELTIDDCRTDEPSRAPLSRANGDTFALEPTLSRARAGEDRPTTVTLRAISDPERLDTHSLVRPESELASRAKTVAMLNVTHEMGNPLNVLLAFAEWMASDPEQPLPFEHAQRLESIVACGRQLRGLMRDVIDIGRFDADNVTLNMSTVDARRCAEAAMAAVLPLARPAGVALICTDAAQAFWFVADARRLQQCLVNLLTNAVEYSRPGGWVRIEIRDEGQECCIAVRDDGAGMDELQRQHLFEPFDRPGRRQRGATQGSGLGLTITRRLVEAMKGRLRVESKPGQGSCFSIVFPGLLGVAGPGAKSAGHQPVLGSGNTSWSSPLLRRPAS